MRIAPDRQPRRPAGGSASGFSRRIAAVAIAALHCHFAVTLLSFAHFIIKPARKKPALAATILRAARRARRQNGNCEFG